MFSSYLDLEFMEPQGWDFNSDEWGIDFEGKLWSALEDMNEVRSLNQKYKNLLVESKEESNKLRIEVEGKRYEIILKEVECVISNLKIKVEGKWTEDCLNVKLKDKNVECLKLEEENIILRNVLKIEKGQANKGEFWS